MNGALSWLAHPEALLPLGLAWLCLAAGLALAHRRGERGLAALIGGNPGRADRSIRDLLVLGALGLVTIAWLGPTLGHRTTRVPASGLDVVLLLDVSRSMEAPDVAPDRMARARRLARGVLARLGEGDRAALAVFAGRGELLTPLTADKGALAEMLPALDTELLRDTGSRGAAGLLAVLPAFDRSGLRPRLLLVVSDGEVGVIPAAVRERMVEAELRVVTALLGTERGSRLPDHGRYLRDREGREVVSQREVGRFAELVEATGGRIFLADEWGEIDFSALIGEVRRDAVPDAEGMIERRVPVPWFGLPAALALVLLALEAWPAAWLRRRHPGARPRRGVVPSGLATRVGARAALVTLGAGLAIVPLSSRTEPDLRETLEARLAAEGPDAGLLIALGVARVRAGASQEAEHAFRAAAMTARRPELAALAWFDLGVLALESGRLEEARDAFFDATTASGGDRSLDREVKFNLEWTLAALRSRENPPSPPPPSSSEREEEPKESREPADGDPEAAEPEPSPEMRTGEEAREREGPTGAPDADAETPPPTLDAEKAEQWLENLDDDVRSALETRFEKDPVRRDGPRW
ncbi:MAG: hypothetical protein CL910_17050 [Deltaproteobacteria bacterium]|nr:hypothetical protein [Deltaproteobacteria bacterium]